MCPKNEQTIISPHLSVGTHEMHLKNGQISPAPTNTEIYQGERKWRDINLSKPLESLA